MVVVNNEGVTDRAASNFFEEPSGLDYKSNIEKPLKILLPFFGNTGALITNQIIFNWTRYNMDCIIIICNVDEPYDMMSSTRKI